MTVKTRHLNVTGMHCSGCEHVIETAVRQLPGVQKADAHYARASLDIVFDDDLIRLKGILQAIEAKGYACPLPQAVALRGRIRSMAVTLTLLVLIGGVAFWGKSQMPGVMGLMKPELNYVMLFSIGFLTSFHCIGMCGAMIVRYATSGGPRSFAASSLAHARYALGKTVSYTAIGAGFGWMGSLITITPFMRGVAATAAGLFLLAYGLSMLNLFPLLRHLSFRLPRPLAQRIATELRGQQSPLTIGLLTGLLLGCGPLQAMYVLAAGTANAYEGATMLFFFGLGTLPMLIGFGYFANLVSITTVNELLRVSAILVLVMGLMMTDRGLRMTESGYDFKSLSSALSTEIARVGERWPSVQPRD